MELLLPEQSWSLGYLPSWKDVPATTRTPPNTEILTPPMAGKPSWLLLLLLKTSCSFGFCQETHQMSTSISKGNKYPQAQCHVSGCLASWQSRNGMWSFSRRASDEEKIFFFLIPARNQILNIVVGNPNGLGSSNKTSWCLVPAVLFDPSLVPVPGSGVMQCSFPWKCARDVFQEENHCQSK